MIDFKLMKHQETAILKADERNDLFIAYDTGTGKSCTLIQILRRRFAENKRVMRTLILAPSVVLRNWKKEFGMFSKVDQNMIHILDQSVKKRIELIKEQKNYSCIFVTNYDVMQDDGLIKAFMDWGVEVLVCDEAHVLKSYKSKRAKNVAKIADKCKHRYMLTGTPILNSAMDLYMPYRIMDGYKGPYSTFGSNFFAFRARYFMDKNVAWAGKNNYFPEWVPKPSAYNDLTEKIKDSTVRILKADCLDLPPLVVQMLEVPLGKDQKKAYEEMRKEFVTWVTNQKAAGEKEAVVARLAITKALRLQQICSGFVTTDSGTTVRFNDNPRLSALGETLEELTKGNKVIVWACFRENYKMIAELCIKLGIRSVEIHGEQSSKEKADAAHAFNTDPSVQVCISNQAAGGVGINLVAATYSVYYSRGFKLGDDVQSEARNYRRGSEVHEKITRINLVSPGTIDEIVAEALAKKQTISDNILQIANKL